MLRPLICLPMLVWISSAPYAQEPRVKIPTEPEWKRISAVKASESDWKVEIHDVRDLLVHDFRMKPFNTAASNAPQQNQQTARIASEQRLLARLRRHIESSDLSTDGFSLEFADAGHTTLVAHGAANVLARLRGKLNAIRASGRRAYSITCRVFRVVDPNAELPAVLRDEPVGEKDTVFVVNPDQAKLLITELEARVKNGENITLVTSPKLTILNEQLGNVMIANQRAYVADYKVVKVLGEESSVIDPEVRTLETGIGIEFRVSHAGDEKHCTMASFYQLAKLREPIETVQTKHGPVQRPVIDSSSLRFKVTVPLSGYVLVSTKASERLGVFLLLIRVDRVDLRRDVLAGVRAVSPGAGRGDGKATIFVDAGRSRGLATGAIVRFRLGEERVCSGTATRVWDDLAEVKVESAEGVDFSTAAKWRAHFKRRDAADQKAVK